MGHSLHPLVVDSSREYSCHDEVQVPNCSPGSGQGPPRQLVLRHPPLCDVLSRPGGACRGCTPAHQPRWSLKTITCVCMLPFVSAYEYPVLSIFPEVSGIFT